MMMKIATLLLLTTACWKSCQQQRRRREAREIFGDTLIKMSLVYAISTQNQAQKYRRSAKVHK